MKVNFRVNPRHLTVDLFMVVFSFFAALFLRVNFVEAKTFLPAMYTHLPLIVFCRLVFFVYFGTSNILWRYVAAVDAFRLAKSVAASTVMIIALSYLLNLGVIPRSIYFIDSFLLIFILASARVARRLVHEQSTSMELKKFGERTLIYGAGATGQGVLKRLLNDGELKLYVVGFVDDDVKKIGKEISGFKVFPGMEHLKDLIAGLQVKKVVVGLPNPSQEFLKQLVATCTPFDIKPLILNSSDGTEIGQTFRKIELKDLLVRPPHKIDLTSTQQMISGKRVLITGAGGSIGSELSRQVLGFNPSRLILLDHSEFNLYTIDSEFRDAPNYNEVVVPCLLDLKDLEGLSQVFSQYSPEIVIHAAAYKHVHLVETNPHSSILNNILGTKNVLQLSENGGVSHFVLISSDKAVNPAGVMGATKRVCEIMTCLAGERTERIFCAVRFGNVLGSSGSLIPILKKQIEENKPLTLTHPDMERYFMLIEEAVSLVLKAASISKPGDINVLKMGKPAKIVDVASSLVNLMGKKETDVQFNFIGLRPGEKMFEELYISGNELETEHPDILYVPKGDEYPTGFTAESFAQQIQQMIEASRAGEKESLYILSRIVNSNYEHPTYQGELKKLKIVSPSKLPS